ncbi:TonB-dependent receptor plug domain-containing protein [Aliarcobacter lanthieri]|uniref:TonB-dependent receptor plug domain-containing protein n=1 Tax=Aliarcobacter lanthieri TaxID=1355374 RepID=UPI00047E65A9|nr:TonB-dependent receptor [Aliarcobacter lanthieri]
MYKQSLFASLALIMMSSTAFAEINLSAEQNNETKRLDEIFVSTKTDKTQEDISASVTVITAEDIAKINATDLKDVLLKSAGIVEIGGARGNGGTFVSIRGTRETDTLFLIDGKRANNTAGYIESSNFQYNMVPLDAIERIEVIKGAKSSIYGSDAMGGVVNIITKKDKRALYGSIDVKAGVSSADNGGNKQSYSANIGGNISEKLYMFLDVNKTNRDATGDNNGTFLEGLDSTSGIAKLKYDIDDTQNIYASYIKGVDKREDYKGPQTYKIERDIYNIGYEKIFDKVGIGLDYTKAKTDTKVSSSVFNGTHDLETDTFKGEVKLSAIDYNYIVLGAEATKEEYSRNGMNLSQNFDRKTYNYYIQDEIEVGDFIFTLGANLDNNDKYGTEWSPNAGAVYKLDDKQRLKINYSEGFKAPTLKQGDGGYVFNERPIPIMNVIILGNDDLKPETSKSYELAYEFYGEDTTFKAAVFRTDLKDMIETRNISTKTTMIPGFPPKVSIVSTNQYQNIEKANIRGFETDFKYDFNESHTINANYTFLKTEDESTNEELEYRPKHTFNLGLSSDFAWGISSYLSANYVGTQYFTDSNNATKKSSGYTVFNAQISKKIFKDLTARIGVNNIADKKFDDGEPYYLERRFAYVGLNYRF